ncbi:hypothetical protein CCYA_CCYA04G1201 [Cyanidiococcus yangmingshanensis]|nr:hypothetical protein CCYA_CCYA04G1201 [Cyanidiococcus yangmingshanensis]
MNKRCNETDMLGETGPLEQENASCNPEEETPQARYLRQVSIWGNSAQRLLQHARVAIIGSASVGAEVAKCLLLSGVNDILLVDDARTTVADSEQNFFLPPEAVGEWRALALAQQLQRLNPFARIQARVGSARTFAAEWTSYQRLSIVIVTESTQSQVQLVADRCWEATTPLLILRVEGLVGYITPQFPEQILFQRGQHPGALSLDCLRAMRFIQPFETLAAWCLRRFWPLSQWDEAQLAQIPWPVLIVLARYAIQNESSLHGARTWDREIVRTQAMAAARCAPVQTSETNESFTEGFIEGALESPQRAISECCRVHDAVPGDERDPGDNTDESTDSKLRPDQNQRAEALLLEQIMERLREWQTNRRLSNWTQALAMLRRLANATDRMEPSILRFPLSFRDETMTRILRAIRVLSGQRGWPVCRELDHLSGDAVAVAALKRLYQEQAERDVEAVCEFLKSKDIDSVQGDLIPTRLVRQVCSNLFFMTVRRTRRYSFLNGCGASIPSNSERLPQARRSAGWFLALHAYDGYQESTTGVQGDVDHSIGLLNEARRLAESWGWSSDLVTPDHVRHIQQTAGRAEPAMAVMLGALAAQEAIKLIIQRFEPLAGTLVYDGYANTASVLGSESERSE